jgi:hypothetical protein
MGVIQMTMNECCWNIMVHCSNEYAKAYAYAWLNGNVTRRMAEYGIPGDAAAGQAVYILSNLGGWRGDVARETRVALKRIVAGR